MNLTPEDERNRAAMVQSPKNLDLEKAEIKKYGRVLTDEERYQHSNGRPK